MAVVVRAGDEVERCKGCGVVWSVPWSVVVWVGKLDEIDCDICSIKFPRPANFKRQR